MLTFVIALSALAGAFDCIIGNRFKLGEKFEEGFLCLGAAALGIAGMICIAPVLGRLIGPVVVPVYRFLGIDPAMFGCLLANNMGGYPLATELADDPRMGLFSGLVVSSMLGAALVYTIPVGLGIVREQDREPFIKGIMIGMIPIPLGSAVGGVMMGIPLGKILHNCLPVILVTVILILGFLLFPSGLLRKFMAAGKGIRALSIFGLGIAAFTSMTKIVLIPGMETLETAMKVVSEMGIVQLGSLPLAALFVRAMKKPLLRLSGKLSISTEAMASLPVACVNVISIFTMVKDMDRRGMVMAAAWCTNTIALLTGHLAYTRAVAPEMVTTVIVSKLASGAAAVLLAWFMEGKRRDTSENNECGCYQDI